MPGVTICWCLAYDWRLAVHSIARAWPAADEVILGIDRNRRTWTGQPFELDLGDFLIEMYREVRARGWETNTPVHIVEEDFYNGGVPTLQIPAVYERALYRIGGNSNALKIDTGERNRLSLRATEGNWIIQLDSDELIADPIAFGRWLHSLESGGYISIICEHVWKIIDDTALVIENTNPWPIGTRRKNDFVLCRTTGSDAFGFMAPSYLVHLTLGGRTRAELEEKLKGWGHAGERDPEEFLRMWDEVTLDNYNHGTRLLSPSVLSDQAWTRLRAVPMAQLLPP